MATKSEIKNLVLALEKINRSLQELVELETLSVELKWGINVCQTKLQKKLKLDVN